MVVHDESSLHGKILHYEPGKTPLPQRSEFISSRPSKELLFMPVDVYDSLKDIRGNFGVYTIYAIGFMQNGEKAVVAIEGCEPFVDVRVPEAHYSVGYDDIADSAPALNPEVITNAIRVLQDHYTNCTNESPQSIFMKNLNQVLRTEVVEQYPFKGFHGRKRHYMRFYFKNNMGRCAFINSLKTHNKSPLTIDGHIYETAHDDLGNNNYYMVVCRDHHMTFSDWVRLHRAQEFDKHATSGQRINAAHAYCVNYKDFRPAEDVSIKQDKSMLASWDIEMFASSTTDEASGTLPDGGNIDDEIFVIGMTFGWHYEPRTFLRVGIVSRPCASSPKYLTIVCRNEKQLLQCFCDLFHSMNPDYINGFNDGDFDWNRVYAKAALYNMTEYLEQKFSVIYNPIYVGKAKVSSELSKAKKENTPSNYKCMREKLEDKMRRQNVFRLRKIKIEANKDRDVRMLQCNGYIAIDVMVIFMQLFPTSEYNSLQYFLQQHNLGSKEDMPIWKLFDIYRRSTAATKADLRKYGDYLIQQYIKNAGSLDTRAIAQEMADIVSYCVTDAEKCHLLLERRNVITDRRQIAHLSFVNISSAFFRANGVKVKNLTIAEGQKRSIAFSNIGDYQNANEGKYPGAFVVPPRLGMVAPKLTLSERIGLDDEYNPTLANWPAISDSDLACLHRIVRDHYAGRPLEACVEATPSAYRQGMQLFLSEENQYPIAGLDFSSLYPSLIMTYNISPEMYVRTAEEAELIGRRFPLYHICFPYNGRTITGWTIRHKRSRAGASADDRFGLFPSILKRLFDERKKMKKLKIDLEHKLEDLETRQLGDTQEYVDTKLEFNYIDSKQKALKVFMNTFYGEIGNKTSPLYELALAGCITSAGQYNLKMVIEFVKQQGYQVYYGDTDSVYISCPGPMFAAIDAQYYSGELDKEDYCTQLVTESFRGIADIRDRVNQMLAEDNGTEFLRMAYEEVLYPANFIGKKKYYGIAHIGQVNFRPSDLFIRGLVARRRGTSEFLKKISMKILWQAMDLHNRQSLRKIIESNLRGAYETEWSSDDFLRSGTYKPKSQNIANNGFVRRMLEEHGIEFKPYERFWYVIAEKYPYSYTAEGNQVALQKMDLMELPETLKKNNYRINIQYYITNELIGELARLILYHSDFHVSIHTEDDAADRENFEYAKKYLNSIAEECKPQFVNRRPLEKSIYKSVNSAVSKQIAADKKIIKFSLRSQNLVKDVDKLCLSNATRQTRKYDPVPLIQKMMQQCGDRYRVEPDAKNTRIYTNFLCRIRGFLTRRNICIGTKLAQMSRELEAILPQLTEVHAKRCSSIERIREAIRKQTDLNKIGYSRDAPLVDIEEFNREHVIEKCIASEEIHITPEERAAIDALEKFCQKLTRWHTYQIQNTKILDHLTALSNKEVGVQFSPPKKNTKVMEVGVLDGVSLL